MAPKGKLHVFTVTQARHAFERSKHILEHRVKVLSEATSVGDAGKIKDSSKSFGHCYIDLILISVLLTV